MELIIKSEFCPSRHSFGGEEANSELAIYSPLQRVQWIRNAKLRSYIEIKGSKFQKHLFLHRQKKMHGDVQTDTDQTH